ncbi:MAG: T9SS type A sorting domain-containing protein [Ignavibacteriales bacterium]|nr:T9SS type A sorting domain-containing protein [Ignavibacteriales bacterium]
MVESLNLNNVSAAGLYYLQRIVTNYWGDPSLKLKYDETTDVKTVELKVPEGFYLNQNYPNPFNPSTKISFSIPEKSFVTLKIYDMLGREVTELVNEELETGSFEKTFDASSLSSGVYIYRITAMKEGKILFNESKQMILIK